MTNPNPDPAKHKKIAIWNAEDWHYEDFEIGERARSIRRTISEGESMMFNALVLDMHPYVADDVFATEEGVFGRRLVAGAMVFSLGLGLMAHNASIPSVMATTGCVSSSRFSSATRSIQFAPIWRSDRDMRRWVWCVLPTRYSNIQGNSYFTASIYKRRNIAILRHFKIR